MMDFDSLYVEDGCRRVVLMVERKREVGRERGRWNGMPARKREKG